MLSVNLLGGLFPGHGRRFGMWRRHPPQEWERLKLLRLTIQLTKTIGGTRVPVPKLHRPGYRSTPTRTAPACPPLANHPEQWQRYGDGVWIRIDREPPVKLCDAPECYPSGRLD